MAAIDELLKRIEDQELRRALTTEVDTLRQTKDFGLVFERHLPENIWVYSQPVRRGSKVQTRSNSDSSFKIVRRIDGDIAVLIDPEGNETTHPLEDLVVIRNFGEPIYPGLTRIESLTRSADRPFHTVINGENYHTIETLLYTLEGQVDVIYLDPPYNSGARDWTYNNDYVDATDEYRHSRWLSFMEKRLTLGRKLLSKDAVMVVTIDEHEVSRLGVLLEQLFPEADITLVTIVINPKGVTRPGILRFSRVEEYAYFCFFGNAGLGGWGDDLLTLGANDLEKASEDESGKRRPRWKGLLRSGTNARRTDRKKMFYPVLIDTQRHAVVNTGETLPFEKEPDFDTQIQGYTPVWPVRSDGSLGNWGVGFKTLRELIEKGYVSLGGYDEKRNTWALSYLSKQPQEQIAAGILEIDYYDEEKNVVDVVYADTESPSRKIKTVWHRTSHDAGAGGTDVITGLLGGREFTFPKSVHAVRDTLTMLTQLNPEAVILDFFAGSGTTAHATMMLNAEDGGSRRCILVTNNEVDVEEQEALRQKNLNPGDKSWEARGIFYRATKPRLEAAITGKRFDGSSVPSKLKNSDGTLMTAGFKENIEFLELTYLDKNDVSRGKAFEAIAPLLWIKAGSLGPMIDSIVEPFAAPEGAAYAILFDPSQWQKFADTVRDHPEGIQLFVVTDSIAQFQQIATELPPTAEVSMLYEDYLRNFEINLGGSE